MCVCVWSAILSCTNTSTLEVATSVEKKTALIPTEQNQQQDRRRNAQKSLGTRIVQFEINNVYKNYK